MHWYCIWIGYKCTCGRCNSSYYFETDKHLKVKLGEHFGISPLILQGTKPADERSISEYLLKSNNHSYCAK